MVKLKIHCFKSKLERTQLQITHQKLSLLVSNENVYVFKIPPIHTSIYIYTGYRIEAEKVEYRFSSQYLTDRKAAFKEGLSDMFFKAFPPPRMSKANS